MNLQNSTTAPVQTVGPRTRPRAVVFGSGIGMFPPLLQRLKDEFDIVATLGGAKESPWDGLWYRLLSIRWPRTAWYRKWRYYMEKTGQSFTAYTRQAQALLEPLEGQYDVIVFFGAMFAPGTKIDKPLFLFTDSCRWLSSRNVHDSISHFANERHRTEWLALEGELYRKAARVFVGSDFVRDALIEHYQVAPERAVTSGFGAGIGFGDPYDKQFDGRTILYIGKGDFEKKGGNLLMKAFETVRRVIPQAELHIVGQDRLPEAEGVVNHGFVRDRNKLLGLMRSAHVFALPSLVDRNPISILEAMASATPCVASDYGAMPEMVGDAGLIAPCNDVEALAAALIRILQDSAYARALGERGRQRFEADYNWDSVWKIVEREIRNRASMNASAPPSASRLDYLDGLRGWASMMVVLSHLWGQFARHDSGFYSSAPLRLISDGHFAVLIFFVLSGTALSLRYTRRPQAVALGWLVAARYVRLVVPIAATTLIIHALMRLGWYGGADVAAAANSPMFLDPRKGLSSTFVDVVRFSLFDVLFRYDDAKSFNASLWTMPVEFFGSFLIYTLLFALSLAPSLRRGHRIAIACVLGLVLFALSKALAACFFGGYVVAEMLFASPRVLASGRWIGAALLAVAAALLALHGEMDDLRGAILALGAVMSVASWPLLRRLLSTRVSRWLGAISFPLYLIHVAVIECAGRFFLALLRGGIAPAIATHITVVLAIPACLLAARMLMPVERWSVRWSRAVGNYRFRPRADARPT